MYDSSWDKGLVYEELLFHTITQENYRDAIVPVQVHREVWCDKISSIAVKSSKS